MDWPTDGSAEGWVDSRDTDKMNGHRTGACVDPEGVRGSLPP